VFSATAEGNSKCLPTQHNKFVEKRGSKGGYWEGGGRVELQRIGQSNLRFCCVMKA